MNVNDVEFKLDDENRRLTIIFHTDYGMKVFYLEEEVVYKMADTLEATLETE